KGPDDFNLHDITRLVDFEHVKSSAVSLNIRPDVWILPFYNLYGIIGKTWTETDVQLSYPVKIHANVKLDGYSYGVGNTIAFGVGPVFAVLDGNLVWTTLEGFKEPVRTFVFSPRIGHIIDLKTKNDRLSNLGIWIGAMRVGMNGITDGSIPLRDVFPDEFWDNKDQKVAEYYEWYDGLDPMDPKKIIAENVFNPIVDNIGNANGDGYIGYKLTKEAKQEWNFLIGAQYQYSPHWQLRAEVGLLADRKSALLSINYRFGIHNRTYLQSIAK
ncbi:MAG: hypothetical protein U9R43_18285, partial [Thermodesulfobacteriota bacterium]|nr:hypothetical protein [Thermodesulfobacteriota bacterium]